MEHHDHADIPESDHLQHLGHVLPLSVYRNVFIALAVLTVITVVVAKFVDLGAGNVVVAMLIASTKALLVALFFMHLKYENPITWLYALFPIFLLVLMLSGIFIDNPNRPYAARAAGQSVMQSDKSQSQHGPSHEPRR